MPLLEIEDLHVDFPTQGSCDSGDCFYVNTVSWRSETSPNVSGSTIATAATVYCSARRRTVG